MHVQCSNVGTSLLERIEKRVNKLLYQQSTDVLLLTKRVPDGANYSCNTKQYVSIYDYLFL